MLRSLEDIHARSPELRAKLLQQLRMSQQLILQVLVERLKLQVELLMKRTFQGMAYYGFLSICCKVHKHALSKSSLCELARCGSTKWTPEGQVDPPAQPIDSADCPITRQPQACSAHESEADHTQL